MKVQRKAHPNIFHVEVDKLGEPGWKEAWDAMSPSFSPNS